MNIIGSVEKLSVTKAAAVNITTGEIKEFTANGSVTVTGADKIQNAIINSAGVKLDKKPTEVTGDNPVQIGETEGTVLVNSFEALQNALIGDATFIKVGNDITITESLNITRDVTIDGTGTTGNYTLFVDTASADGIASGIGLASTNVILQNLNVELSTTAPTRVHPQNWNGVNGSTEAWWDNLIEVYSGQATLENVSVKGGHQAAILVLDGGNAILKGNITLENNFWGGIEVGNTVGTKLEFAEGVQLNYSEGNKKNAPVVWIDANEVNPTTFVKDFANVLSTSIYVNSTGGDVADEEVENKTATQVWFARN